MRFENVYRVEEYASWQTELPRNKQMKSQVGIWGSFERKAIHINLKKLMIVKALKNLTTPYHVPNQPDWDAGW